MPPEVVAALVSPNGETSPSRAAREGEKVPRSFRAAILAGLIVAIVSAATNATFAAEASQDLSFFSLGSANAPIIVALLLAALWSGARTSALCIFVTHRVLAAMQRTSHLSYGIAGGVVALAFGLLLQALGKSPGPGGISMEVLSGVGAGLFYRLFAGAQRPDD
ncbi:MAG: hypothetical protein ABSC72_09205 [Methylovirgula sp.]